MAFVGPEKRVTGVYCREHWSRVGYPLLQSAIHYNVRDVNVEATLTQTFQAETNVEREILYIFEIPPEAAVNSFSATVGTIKVDAIIEEKIKANTIYQKAVASNVQAFKLDQLNVEVFQISLGAVKPGDKITIRITYVHIIASDTLEDSTRLTIPSTLAAARVGAAPAGQTTAPRRIAGGNAVEITVSIEMQDRVMQVFSPTHQLAPILYGFCDESRRALPPREQANLFDPNRALVTYSSHKFLEKNFVLVWKTPGIDEPRCLVETLDVPGEPRTTAFVLTQVSPVALEPDTHEFLFLIDYSGSMGGARIATARRALCHMLDNLPSGKSTTFNIFLLTQYAKSILANGASVPYDTSYVAYAKSVLPTAPFGGTDINQCLKTVIGQRNMNAKYSNVIVITDGLDSRVPAAMETVRSNVAVAASTNNLLRVFVMGVGDEVSQGMCESLARVGMGATVYVNESSFEDVKAKAETLILSVGRAPIRVRSIDWGVRRSAPPPPSSPLSPSASARSVLSVLSSGGRASVSKAELGPRGKGDDLAPPPKIQQAPKPGTMFWAIRSSWFAISQADIIRDSVKITFDVHGVSTVQTLEIPVKALTTGRLIHTLAARANIQVFEDRAPSLANDPTNKYQNEAEIVRLGKTYGLVSSQTSFVATMDGVGTQTTVLHDQEMSRGSTVGKHGSSVPELLRLGNTNSVTSTNPFLTQTDGVRVMGRGPVEDSSDEEDEYIPKGIPRAVFRENQEGHAYMPQGRMVAQGRPVAEPTRDSVTRNRLAHQLFGAPPPPAFTAPRPSAPSAPPPPPRSQSYHSVSHYGVSLQPILTGYTDDSVKRSVQQQARSQDESWSSAQRPSPFDEPTHGISHMVSSRRSLSRRSAGQEFANTPPPQYEARGERSEPASPQTIHVDRSHADMSDLAQTAQLYLSLESSEQQTAPQPPVSELTSAQSPEGSFPAAVVEDIVFPSTGLPAAHASISSLSGSEYVKGELWATILAIAFLQKKYADEKVEWARESERALDFVRTTLECSFGLSAGRVKNVMSLALADAFMYIE